MEEEVKVVQELEDDELDEVSGGKFVIDNNNVRFCPYCQKKHIISSMKGKHKIGKYYHKVYWCNKKRKYFIKATNGYFTLEDERIPSAYLED